MGSINPSTLFEKVWQAHVITDMENGWSLLHIDRQLVHDLSGARSFAELEDRQLPVSQPSLTFATADHAVSTAPGRTGTTFAGGAKLWSGLKKGASDRNIRFFDVGQSGQGIVHVMGPELGIIQPGSVVVCGDSHTCTNGALGSMAFGIGASEVIHVLATQTLMQRKPRTMRILFEGEVPYRVSPKDLIMRAIASLGAASGAGFAIEYAGSAIDRMCVEERMTVCNLSIEMGSKIGMIAPDEKVFEYLKGRPFAPAGPSWNNAVDYWSTLCSDVEAKFDREVVFDANQTAPMVTWGTSPDQAVAVTDCVPSDADAQDESGRKAWREAREYMGVSPGVRLMGQKVDRVFIGSCSNSRLSDLRVAAALLSSNHIAKHVTAWVVPGSEDVKRAAEAEGLDEQFRAAGFQWREPGCGMCVAANGETAAAGERVVSTSNRNFVGRQGPNVRTHLSSPATAVASALAGYIADPRTI